MRPRTTGRLGWSTAGALLAFLACVLSRPAMAQAGCLHPANPRDAATGTAHFDRLARAGALASEPGEPAPRPDRPSPCAGLSCSGVPAIPLAPIPTIPYRGATEAILESLAPWPDSGSAQAPPVGAILRPSHEGAAIFHPPRPASLLPTR